MNSTENLQRDAVQEEYCLELYGVGKRFGGLCANNDVNLKVRSGERLAIIGPNGAGKTTLFNMISGEFEPTEGKILLFGEDITKLGNYRRVRKGLARTYQIAELFPDMNIQENIVLGLMGTRKGKFSMFRALKSRKDLFREADALMSRVNLQDKKGTLIKNLSYGDQRLVELLLALSSDPKIICLDEPNAGLSSAESKVMVNVIKALPRDITILLIEHDMDLVFDVVDRIMVLHDGNVVATDDKDKIRENEHVQRIYLGVEDANAVND